MMRWDRNASDAAPAAPARGARAADARALSSLRVRLPVVMSAFIAVVLAAFLWVAFREVESALLQAGAARAQAAADQLATLLAQQAQQRHDAMQRIAQSDAVRGLLTDGAGGDADAARRQLAPLAVRGQPPVELWDASGRRVLTVAPPASPAVDAGPALPPTTAPSAPGAWPYQRAGDIVFSDTVAEVRGDDARVGYVLSRRVLSSAAASDMLARLVGGGARVKIGNQQGGLWTDFGRPVAAPPVDGARGGVGDYRTEQGEDRLGAYAVIRGTPWAIWVDFPRGLVVAPARVFLVRMLAFGLAFIIVAALAAHALSARITTPLGDLTRAAEALAAGRELQPVHITRHDEIGRLGGAFDTMAAQVRQTQQALEARVRERTQELDRRVSDLQALTGELEAFSYSVSHDLRAPLRHVTGFAALVEKTSGPSLDEQGRRYVRTISEAAARMGRLIDDLLVFSRMGRSEMHRGRVDLASIVDEIRREAAAAHKDRQIAWTVHPLPDVTGDAPMLRQVLENLIANAVKYTSTRPAAEIEIGANGGASEAVVFVRDNGVGFDMQYRDKLFGVFQRLHRSDEFEGTGIGLANVKRIVHRHGGRVWAEGRPGAGATFFFSLPQRGAPPT